MTMLKTYREKMNRYRADFLMRLDAERKADTSKGLTYEQQLFIAALTALREAPESPFAQELVGEVMGLFSINGPLHNKQAPTPTPEPPPVPMVYRLHASREVTQLYASDRVDITAMSLEDAKHILTMDILDGNVETHPVNNARVIGEFSFTEWGPPGPAARALTAQKKSAQKKGATRSTDSTPKEESTP